MDTRKELQVKYGNTMEKLPEEYQDRMEQQMNSNMMSYGMEHSKSNIAQEKFIKKGLIDKIFNPNKEKTYKYPVLFLMMNNGDIEAIQNQEPNTIYVIKTKSDTKGIYLAREKMRNFKHGGEDIPCWFAHEDYFLPYDHDSRADGKIIYNFTMSISQDNRLLEEKAISERTKRIVKTILIIAFAAVVLGYIAYKTGLLDSLLQTGSGLVNTTIQTGSNLASTGSQLATGGN